MLAGLSEVATTGTGDWSGERGRLKKENVIGSAKKSTSMARGGKREGLRVKKGFDEKNRERERKEKEECEGKK